jgi:hypothetical protein
VRPTSALPGILFADVFREFIANTQDRSIRSFSELAHKHPMARRAMSGKRFLAQYQAKLEFASVASHTSSFLSHGVIRHANAREFKLAPLTGSYRFASTYH